VQVEVEDGVLVISGERRNEMEDRREGFFHSERATAPSSARSRSPSR
jgi:HSP20 family molecular chaperone IbpA